MLRIKDLNYARAQEVVEEGRKILKIEWERVKEGEKAYKNTKKYSFLGGVFLLTAILLIGGYAVYSVTKLRANGLADSIVETKIANPTQCWQLHSLNKRVYKLNSCTGEAVELKLIGQGSK